MTFTYTVMYSRLTDLSTVRTISQTLHRCGNLGKETTRTLYLAIAGLLSSRGGRRGQHVGGRLWPERRLSLLGFIEVVAVGTAEGEVLKLVPEGHAIVGVALGADESVAVVGPVPHQVLHHLKQEEATDQISHCCTTYTMHRFSYNIAAYGK